MTLDSHDRPVVPLSEELEFLDAYLRIQRERFRDRLRVRMEIPDEVRRAQVPSLILQPLVENAIRHGIGGDPESGEIVIRASRDGERLILEVSDDGPGYREDEVPPQGMGLRNVRARLAEIYPGRHEFSIRPLAEKGTTASMVIPLQKEPAHGTPADEV